MTDEDYIGYVLDLLDPEERAAVGAHLAAHPDAAAQVDRLRAALLPLEADRADPPAPAGLATRTVARLAAYLVEHEPRPAPSAPTPADDTPDLSDLPVLRSRVYPADRPESRAVGGRFRLDLVVAAGIGLLAVGLGVSFVSKARYRNDVYACQNNLLTLHQGLNGYADTHGGRFPQIGIEPYPTAGSFVTALADAGQYPPGFRPTCPAAAPAIAPVGYTYTLGHVAPGGGVLGLERSDDPGAENDLLPLAADNPAAAVAPGAGPVSPHAGLMCVLYMHGNVRATTSAAVGPNGDDIFRNHYGRVAAGVNRADAVLGRAGDQP